MELTTYIQNVLGFKIRAIIYGLLFLLLTSSVNMGIKEDVLLFFTTKLNQSVNVSLITSMNLKNQKFYEVWTGKQVCVSSQKYWV